MQEVFNISVTLLIIIVSMNSFLMVGSALLTNEVLDTSELILPALPSGLGSGEWNDADLNKSDLELTIREESEGSIVTSLYDAGVSIPILGDLIGFAVWILSWLLNFLFYYISVLQFMSIPGPIIYIVTVPLAIIEGLGLFALIKFVKEVFLP